MMNIGHNIWRWVTESYREASLVAQTVKCLSAMWETWVQSPGQEDPLDKKMATHSNTLAWKIPWTEEHGRLQSMGSQRVRLLHQWDFPGKNTGVGCHFLLQEIFPTQGLNPGLPHCRSLLYRLSHHGSPYLPIESSNNTCLIELLGESK